MKHLIFVTSLMAIAAAACSPQKLGSIGGGNGTSVVSSINGDQKDIKELTDNFNGFKARLLCDGKTWESTNVTMAEKSLDIVFAVRDKITGDCQVELRGEPLAGKKVSWTSPDSSVGLLYQSVRSAVNAGVLTVNFYKTFILTDSSKTYRPLLVHATFSAKYLADGADKAVLKSVNMACKDRADVAAKLSQPISFTKDVKEATADISFPQVEVGKASDCVFKALFDERTELSTEAMALSVEAGDNAQELKADFSKIVTVEKISIDGTINNEQMDKLLFSRHLTATSLNGVLEMKDGKASRYRVGYQIRTTKDGDCQVQIEGFDSAGKSLWSTSDKISFKVGQISEQYYFAKLSDETMRFANLEVSSKCTAESTWTRLRRSAISTEF